jgi:hypothetical protein
MRNIDQHQDREESSWLDASQATAPDRERDQPVSSTTADSKVAHANVRRLSRAEERHLREWAGTLVSGHSSPISMCLLCHVFLTNQLAVCTQ